MFNDDGEQMYWCQTQEEFEIIRDYVKAVENFIAKSSRPDVSFAEFHDAQYIGD